MLCKALWFEIKKVHQGFLHSSTAQSLQKPCYATACYATEEASFACVSFLASIH